MRKLLLLTAAVPLLIAPPALANENKAERESVCLVPDVDLSYDTQTFTTLATLPASGCQSREHTQFVLSASISRLDKEGGRDMVGRSVMCGPFRAARDADFVGGARIASACAGVTLNGRERVRPSSWRR